MLVSRTWVVAEVGQVSVPTHQNRLEAPVSKVYFQDWV
jgi:hypothetical protein